ncbi:thioredoxin family protein [Paenibacillus sp. XY044]|uniref:thioredoxin family protein n=1 Tax=Paenibacillus sp. XY044 TaxID=2026089 RepID=UPI00211B6BB1|nr:thioredoxin family protein [Paenibacillus sp. XY044]
MAMTEAINLQHKVGQGISPQQFMERMQVREMINSGIPNTVERFLEIYHRFHALDSGRRKMFTSTGERLGLRCLILCTDWCPDVIWNVPVLFRVMEQCGLPVEVLVMEEHLETMDLFLTDGGRAQPVGVFVDRNGDVLGQWGARPAYIQQVMDDFKASRPDRQSPSYQEQLNQVYRDIGNLYLDGDRYQDVILQELDVLFHSFV